MSDQEVAVRQRYAEGLSDVPADIGWLLNELDRIRAAIDRMLAVEVREDKTGIRRRAIADVREAVGKW